MSRLNSRFISMALVLMFPFERASFLFHDITLLHSFVGVWHYGDELIISAIAARRQGFLVVSIRAHGRPLDLGYPGCGGLRDAQGRLFTSRFPRRSGGIACVFGCGSCRLLGWADCVSRGPTNVSMSSLSSVTCQQRSLRGGNNLQCGYVDCAAREADGLPYPAWGLNSRSQRGALMYNGCG